MHRPNQEQSTGIRWWLVRSSKNPALFYCLTRRGCGPIECECAWAQYRRQSNQDRKVCRHVMAVLAGEAREARPVRRAPVLTVAGEGFGMLSSEAA